MGVHGGPKLGKIPIIASIFFKLPPCSVHLFYIVINFNLLLAVKLMD